MHDATKRFKDVNRNMASKNANIIIATNANQDIDEVSEPLDKLNHKLKVFNPSDNINVINADNDICQKKCLDAKQVLDKKVSEVKDVKSDNNLNLEMKSKFEIIGAASEMKKLNDNKVISVKSKNEDESIKINATADILENDDTMINKISTNKINNTTVKVSSSNQNYTFRSSVSNIENVANSKFIVVESKIESNMKFSKNYTESVSVNDEKITHSCHKCDYKTNKLGVLNAHRRMFHVSLSNHTKSAAINMNVNSSQENNRVTSKFKCDHCDYKAKSKTGLEAHVLFVH